jgi:hypothetical protein
MVAGFQLGPRPQGSLLGPLTPSMAPIQVYAGLPKRPANMELASDPARKRKAKQRGTETATASPAPAARQPAVPKQGAAPKQAAASKQAPAGPAETAAAAKKAKPKAKPVAATQQ